MRLRCYKHLAPMERCTIGELAKSLFETNLLDEVVLNIHPVLLGSGIPLFHEMTKQIDLEFLDCKILKGGYLLVSYRVKH